MHQIVSVQIPTQTPYPHDVGHPLIRAIEHKFIHNLGSYDDIPAPVCDRWMIVRAVLRDHVRGRHLYEDLSDIYALAVREWTNPMLFAAYELASLQYWFYVVLRNNRLVRKHVQEWNVNMVYAWRAKMAERDRITLPWRRAYEDRAILTPHAPLPPVVPPWQH